MKYSSVRFAALQGQQSGKKLLLCLPDLVGTILEPAGEEQQENGAHHEGDCRDDKQDSHTIQRNFLATEMPKTVGKGSSHADKQADEAELCADLPQIANFHIRPLSDKMDDVSKDFADEVRIHAVDDHVFPHVVEGIGIGLVIHEAFQRKNAAVTGHP